MIVVYCAPTTDIQPKQVQRINKSDHQSGRFHHCEKRTYAFCFR